MKKLIMYGTIISSVLAGSLSCSYAKPEAGNAWGGDFVINQMVICKLKHGVIICT